PTEPGSSRATSSAGAGASTAGRARSGIAPRWSTRAVVRLLRGSAAGQSPGLAGRLRLPAVANLEAGRGAVILGNGMAKNSVAIAGQDDTRWTGPPLLTSTFG